MRVWIELDYPAGMTNEQADKACEQATRMLRRLVLPEQAHLAPVFFWHKDKQKYALQYSDKTFKILEDNGDWFMLDYLGREHFDRYEGD